MSEFNINLKKVREKRGLTAKELAIDLGIPYTTYIKYEWNGEPRYDTLIKIAKHLNTSIDELLGHEIDEYEHYKQWLSSLEGIEVYANSDNRIVIAIPFHYDEAKIRISVSDKNDFISLAKCILKEISSDLKTHERDLTISLLRFIHMTSIGFLDKSNLPTKWDMDIKAEPPTIGNRLLLNRSKSIIKNPPPNEVGEGLKG